MGMEISKMLKLMVVCAVATLWFKSSNFVSSPERGRSALTKVYLGHGYQERMSPRAHDPGYAEPDTKGAKAFTAAEATGATAEVTFKKRPFWYPEVCAGGGRQGCDGHGNHSKVAVSWRSSGAGIRCWRQERMDCEIHQWCRSRRAVFRKNHGRSC